jgi:hypothetical protein
LSGSKISSQQWGGGDERTNKIPTGKQKKGDLKKFTKNGAFGGLTQEAAAEILMKIDARHWGSGN